MYVCKDMHACMNWPAHRHECGDDYGDDDDGENDDGDVHDDAYHEYNTMMVMMMMTMMITITTRSKKRRRRRRRVMMMMMMMMVVVMSPRRTVPLPHGHRCRATESGLTKHPASTLHSSRQLSQGLVSDSLDAFRLPVGGVGGAS